MKMNGAIFDMDGLLFDSEAIFQSVWQARAKERQERKLLFLIIFQAEKDVKFMLTQEI